MASGLASALEQRLDAADELAYARPPGTRGLDDPVNVDPAEAITGDGTGPAWEQGEIPIGPLSELVEAFNSRFGTELSEADALVPLLKVSDVMVEDESLAVQAAANEFEDFQRGKDRQVIAAALNAQDQLAETREKQDDLLRHLLDDDFRTVVSDVVLRSVYERLRGADCR